MLLALRNLQRYNTVNQAKTLCDKLTSFGLAESTAGCLTASAPTDPLEAAVSDTAVAHFF